MYACMLQLVYVCNQSCVKVHCFLHMCLFAHLCTQIFVLCLCMFESKQYVLLFLLGVNNLPVK